MHLQSMVLQCMKEDEYSMFSFIKDAPFLCSRQPANTQEKEKNTRKVKGTLVFVSTDRTNLVIRTMLLSSRQSANTTKRKKRPHEK